MNEQIRKLLIDTARTTNQFVFYSEIVSKCNLSINLKSQGGRDQLSRLLGEVSEFENNNGRPLLSSMAIYKDEKKNDHGDGFYVIASRLKKKKFGQLKAQLFGFEEAEQCRRFWQNDRNYKKYFSISASLKQPQTLEDLFIAYTTVKGDTKPHHWKKLYIAFIEDVRKLQKALRQNPQLPLESDQPYKALSPELRSYRSFMLKWLKEHRNGISSRGQSVLSDDDFERIIKDKRFKTIARTVIESPSNESYEWLRDWWIENPRISNRPLLVNRALAACDPAHLSSVVDRPKLLEVINVLSSSFGFQIANPKSNWYEANVQVTAWLDDQLKGVLQSTASNRLEQIIWRNIFTWMIFERFNRKELLPPDTLNWIDKPTNGPAEVRTRKPTFNESDNDYVNLAREQKELGDAGENLVKLYEIDFLKKHGLGAKAKLVEIVKDGKGYDVRSFDKEGNEKFIEVKTTTGDQKTPFFLSENEVAFMRLNKKKYSIYRIFQYDEEYNSGKCFALWGDVEGQILMQPIQYRVSVKGLK
jgi:hypothetical protein